MSEPAYYLARDGQTYGPYSTTALAEMIQAGNVAGTDQVCETGSEEWQPVEQVFGMAPEPAAPPPTQATTANVSPKIPVVTEAMVDALDNRFRGKLVGVILCLMLAVMPLLAKMDAKGRSEAQILQQEARGRDSGKKALSIILAKWWPVTMILGGAGVAYFIRQAARSRQELKAVQKLFKAQQATGGSQRFPRPSGKARAPRK